MAAGSAVARQMRITRLGEGVDTSRHLRDEAIERTIAVLRGFRLVMDGAQVARARMVATSAVRDASDGQRFLSSAAEVVGVEAELLSGEEEGRLSYRARRPTCRGSTGWWRSSISAGARPNWW